LIDPQETRKAKLAMFDEPQWDCFKPERSALKEIPPASDRLKKCKTRVLNLLG